MNLKLFEVVGTHIFSMSVNVMVLFLSLHHRCSYLLG